MGSLRINRVSAAGCLVRWLVCVLALLCASLLFGTTTEVTLKASATPSAADPGVTNVTVVGYSFPSGTIPPANVTVTLVTTTSGSGPSGTTAAIAVTVVSGTTEAVTFKVPTSIAVSAATSYQVSIAGATSTGATFESGNTASLTVNPPAQITTTSPLLTGTVAVNYSQELTATGGSGVYTWALTAGTLPGGLTLNTATGVISGEPTTKGLSHFEIKVTDSLHLSAGKEFALTIDPALAITTSSPLPTGTVGVNYSLTLKATGGSGQYAWSVIAGGLPGLSLNAASGLISGQPTTAGPANFTIQVTDTNQATATQQFALTINPPLLITTTSPLPAATATVAYSQTFAASGGAGGYTWSAAGLPAWLSISAAGALSGTPPLTAVDSTFIMKVADSSNNKTSGTFTVPLTLAITSTSPLPTGQIGVNYSQTLTATGGTGQYTWSVITGSLPDGLTLTAASGLISGQPTTATGASFTIQVKDSRHDTAVLPLTLSISPAATLLTVSPNASNAGLSLQVAITGSFTHFAQSASMASFGPGIAVGGGTPGQPGPITVTDATDATAEIVIGAAAATGAQTVTVTTGTEQASLANGFSIQAAVPYTNIDMTTTTPIASGFSGFDDEHTSSGVEYYDPKFVSAVQALKPGSIRFPSGTGSMAFDWQAGQENQTWINQLSTEVPSSVIQTLDRSQELTQAQGGIYFSDYATFLQAVGAWGVVAFNSYTDTNPNSASNMVLAAQSAGVDIREWDLGNEPYLYPGIYPTAAAYAKASYPYYMEMASANPTGAVGVFFRGAFSGIGTNYEIWDDGMAAYSPAYWGAVSQHFYPSTDTSLSTVEQEETLNGLLAYGTTQYLSSYLLPLIGANTPVFITEVNSIPFTGTFETYLYNGIFLAEFIARMSTVPNVQGVGVCALYTGNNYDYGVIRAVDDFQAYLRAQVAANPNYSTDTATDPNTQFSFYYSAPALALEVLNLAVNNSTNIWPTTVTGSPTVPILGYDGNPIPAIFAQGYMGDNGLHYLLVTNKSGSSVPLALEVNGSLLETTVTVSYVSGSDTAQNTATDQNNVQIVTTTSPNPITLGPYSVTRVQW